MKATSFSPMIAVVAAVLLAPLPAESAELRTKKKAAATAEAPVAQLRIWKEFLAEDRAVRVVVKPSGKRGSPLEIQAGEGLQLLDYQEVAAGPATLEITDGADAKVKLATVPLTLGSGAFLTALIRGDGANVAVELIDDTAQPNGAGELTVRNLAANINTLRIKIGDDVNIRLEGASALARLRGLPLRIAQIDTIGTDKAGKQSNWANEVDFAKTGRVTLLVYPDAYGRIRPRIVVDGRLNTTPAEPGAGSGE